MQGVLVDGRRPSNPIVEDYLMAAQGDVDSAIAAIMQRRRQISDPANDARLAHAQEEISQLRGRNIHIPGYTYEANIHARPEQFLDWDRPLSGQSPSAQLALRPFVDHMRGFYRGDFHMLPEHGGDMGDIIRAWDYMSPAQTGARNLSETLRDTGVPGIRYLDQGSRGAGHGTSNYVLFDENLIEILRRYGILGPAVGAGGAAAIQGDRQPQ
jgi:hypothetical protein